MSPVCQLGKNKKSAHDLKIPVPLENHVGEVRSPENQNMDIERNMLKIHRRMKEDLKPLEWKVYEGLFIKGEKEEDVAKALGYITSEKKRSPGYKQIKNIRKSIIEKVKKLIGKDKIDIF